MKFHLFWGPPPSTTLDTPSRLCTSDIFEVTLSHREAEIPTLRVTVHGATPLEMPADLPEPPVMSLMGEDQGAWRVIFQGGLAVTPIESTPDTLTYELHAGADKAQTAYTEALEALGGNATFDPLFGGAGLLRGGEPWRSTLQRPCWSRIGKPFCWSTLDHGSKMRRYTDAHILEGSLETSLPTTIPQNLTVTLTAEWQQDLTNHVDLGPELNRRFEGGYVNTLTGPALERHWWSPKTRLSKTGYQIVESKLTPLTGDIAAGPVRERARSTPFNDKGHTLPRSWFDATLIVRYRYQQKRVEHCTFTLQNACVPLRSSERDQSAPPTATEQLSCRLQDIKADVVTPIWEKGHPYEVGAQVIYGTTRYACQVAHTAADTFWGDQDKWAPQPHVKAALTDHGSPTFFGTPRGHKAIEAAIDQAAALLAAKARVCKITFQVPLSEALDLDLDTYVQLEGVTLPHGLQGGKLTHYGFHIQGESAIASLTLMTRMPADPPAMAGSMTAGSMRDALSKTPLGLPYALDPTALPKKGLVTINELSAAALLEGVTITNPGDAQDALLQQAMPETVTAARKVVGQHPTNIRLELMDMTASDQLEHTITVEVPEPIRVVPHHP